MARTRSKPSEGLLGAYDGTYLTCRSMGHAWEVVGFYRLNGEVRRRLDCGRCGTERLDRWGTNGARFGSGYTYVDGYTVEQDENGVGVSTTDVRLETLHRATVYASQDAMLAAMTNGARS